MWEQDALFCFFDGLSTWFRMKLERHGVLDLASAISIAECVVEFKRDSSKGLGKKTRGNDKGGGDRNKSLKKGKPSKDKWKGKKDESPMKYSCCLYNRPHRAFECPKKGKLAVLTQEEEEK